MLAPEHRAVAPSALAIRRQPVAPAQRQEQLPLPRVWQRIDQSLPQCRIGDFYRELGDAFGVALTWSNRWGSFKMVRDKWHDHLEATCIRPVLSVDEAQETLPAVLRELRLLTSQDFESQ